MSQLEFSTREQTKTWARDFARSLRRPSIVLLSGPMGAGKTQLVRWMVEALGSTDSSSPTFAIHQSYQTPGGAVEHLDLYRIEKAGDFESAGLWDLLREGDTLIFIEWPERVGMDVWPSGRDLYEIKVSVSSEEGRTIAVEKKYPPRPGVN